MKTEQLFISSRDIRYPEVMEMTESFLSDLLLEDKDALRFRLLVEETLGMVQNMTDEFIAYISMDSDGDNANIVLDIKTKMDADKKVELLSVSKTGKNTAVRSFMGQIGELIERGMLNFGSLNNVRDQFSSGLVSCEPLGMETGVENAMDASFVWSLYQYKNSLADDENPEMAEAWDELEKSIVANIADDVVVGVKKDRASITITKKIA